MPTGKFIVRSFLILAWIASTTPALLSQINASEVNDSPYGVIYNHLYYLQPDSYDPAKAARSFPIQGAAAEEAAIKLKQILDGSGMLVDINRLPVQFNYIDSVSGESIYFIDRDEPLIYVEKIDTAWYYSRTTVEQIEAMHKRIYPLGTTLTTWFQSPDWQYDLFGIKLWQWVGLFTLLLLAMLFFWLVSLILRPVVRKLAGFQLAQAEALQKHFDRLARLLSLAITVKIAGYFLPMLLIDPHINTVLIKGLHILFLFFLIFIVNQILAVVFHYLDRLTARTENTLDDQLMPVLQKVAIGIVWGIGIIYILDSLDVNVTAFLAGLSIGGLALALAAQDTVKNFFGSIMIFVDRPFQIGDWIHFDDVDGVVEEVGLRSTRIRTFANSITYIPNGMLANKVVDNYGLRKYRRFKTDIGVTYDTQPDLLNIFVDGIREIIKAHPTTRKDYFEVHLNSFASSSLNILLYTFFEAPSWTDELKGRHEIMYAIIQLANRLGIRFAFPTQTVHIEELPGAGSTTPTPPSPEDALQTKSQTIQAIRKYFSELKDDDPDKFHPLGGA